MHGERTGVHSTQHAGDELVDAITLLNQWRQGRYPALVVVAATKVRKDELLERVNLILQRHQV